MITDEMLAEWKLDWKQTILIAEIRRLRAFSDRAVELVRELASEIPTPQTHNHCPRCHEQRLTIDGVLMLPHGKFCLYARAVALVAAIDKEGGK